MTSAQRRYREGLAHLAAREFAEATVALEEATRLEPGQPAAWLALGLARRELDQPEGALAAFARARSLDPALPQVNGQMGLVLQALGRLPEAVERLAEEARRFPGVARNHNNLAMSLVASGQEAPAQEAFVRAIRVDGDYLPAHANLAALFQRRGDLGAAEAALRQVIRLAPGDAAAHARLGQILTTTWRVQEAEPVLRKAVSLAPEDPSAARTLAWALRNLNRPEEAKAVARATLGRHPDDLQANVVERLALPVVYAGEEELARARRDYSRGLDELVARGPRFAASPGQVLSLAWDNFYLAYQGQDDRALQEKYAAFISGLGRLASPRHYEPRARREAGAGQRVRVGLLSSFFRDCTIGKYFGSWAADLDRARFDVFAYYTGHVTDDFSATLAKSVEHYRRILDRVERVADAVLSDRLDVLVFPDVGMNSASYILAGMRLAPVQCAGWGHPVTTGQDGIDFFLTCGAMEPEGAESHYTERLVRLPGIGTRYARPGPASAKSRGELGLPGAGALFLCPQSLFKIHPDNDALFARILAAEPGSRLVFFRDHDDPLTGHFRRRLFGILAGAGVDGEARTVFLGRLDHADFLRVNACCDAMLDTLHWSGGNTTLDALAAALPVVTLPGEFMRGRQSMGMLRLLGLDELVARDVDDYVRIAVRLGRDAAWRDAVSMRIAQRSAALFDRREPVEALGAFLESVACGA